MKKRILLPILFTLSIGLLTSCNSTSTNSWLVGNEAPTESVGNINDFYLDTSTYDLYQKNREGWIKIGNIKGENGQNGLDGKTPTIEISDDGYWIIDGVKTDVLAGTRKKADWNADGKLKILTIGNSFSDDTMEYMYQIASSAGVQNIELGNLYIGGCSLETHYKNAQSNSGSYEYRVNNSGTWSTTKNYKMLDAVQSNDWDFISFQQASGYSGIESSYSYLDGLMDIVRENCISKDTRFVWNMTWAYQQNSSHGDFPKYDKSQDKMYTMICETVQNQVLTNEKIEIVSPTGTAIQNTRKAYLGDHLTRDGYHLTLTYGRYIAGCTFFSALTSIDADKISFYPNGTDAQLKKTMTSMDLSLIKESVQNAIKNPYQVTNSSFEIQTINNKQYIQISEEMMEYKDYAFYNSSANDNYYEPKFNDSISKNYITTRKFNKKEIPVGSLITIAENYQYRPEGWISGNKNETGRPDNVSTTEVIVDAYWWGRFTERAFNISLIAGGAISSSELKNAHNALKIYVPVE